MFTHPFKPWIVNTDLHAHVRYGTKVSPRNHGVSFEEPQHYIINSTNLCRTLHYRVEHRLHVRGRAADDTEHFGRRRLMLQGFSQLSVAILDLFEQSHVLDCNHGLICESFKKRNLLFRERANFLTPDCDASDGTTFP